MAALTAGSAGAVELVSPSDPWVSIEGSPPAATVRDGERTAVKLPCPFSKLEGWRYGWDVAKDLKLSDHRWFKLRVRADHPDRVAGLIVYFRSHSGWFTGALGAPTEEWTILTATRLKFKTEGVPGGWDNVSQMRVSVLPAGKLDTAVYIAGVEGTSAMTGEDAVRVGPYSRLAGLKDAVAGVAALEPLVAEGEDLLRKAGKEGADPPLETQKLLLAARGKFVEAYVRSQKPKAGEFRAAWCHSGTGPEMGWTKTIEALADNGFNAVFPNLLWSGVAYYPSKVVPVAPVVAAKGDQLKEILAVAKRRGVAVHVWKVCWQFGWQADPKVAVPFRFAGRMQVDGDGKRGEWLCPSDPRNRRYELDAIEELVRNYDIDGFQLDYIRFDGDTWCFCDSCRSGFQKEIMKRLRDWPAPVLEDGEHFKEFRDFRRNVITSFVRETREAIKRIKPGVQLSAAVFPVPERARETVLQDWSRWAREGLLDFVCPMNYTEDLAEMRSRAKSGLAAVEGKIPVHQGLFAAFSPQERQEPDMAVAQIVAARELGASGFVLFEIQDHMLKDLLPQLRLGVTAE